MKHVVMSVVLSLFVATSALADTSKEFVQSKTDTVLNIVQKSKDVVTAKKEITKESGRHRNDGNDDNRLFTRGTNYQCGRP